jgi:hypothetical protein
LLGDGYIFYVLLMNLATACGSFFALFNSKSLKMIEKIATNCRLALYQAFGHIISNAPVPAVITEAHQVTTI